MSANIGKIDRCEVLRIMFDDGYVWETTRFIYHQLNGLEEFENGISFRAVEKISELRKLGCFLSQLKSEGLVEKADTNRAKWRITEEGVRYVQGGGCSG